MADKRSNPRIPFQMASARPKLAAPRGKPLIVHVVVNIEYWQFDQPMPRTIVVPPHGRSHIPDIPNFSWSEYGNRVGMPRILEALAERKLPASASINASAGNPRILALPVHPHLTGVPHRIGFFCEILDALLKRNDTVFMVGEEIANWYRKEVPA